MSIVGIVPPLYPGKTCWSCQFLDYPETEANCCKVLPHNLPLYLKEKADLVILEMNAMSPILNLIHLS